jgi:hypothetical protein
VDDLVRIMANPAHRAGPLHAAALEAAREAPALEALIGSFGSYPAMASSMIAASEGYPPQPKGEGVSSPA